MLPVQAFPPMTYMSKPDGTAAVFTFEIPFSDQSKVISFGINKTGFSTNGQLSVTLDPSMDGTHWYTEETLLNNTSATGYVQVQSAGNFGSRARIAISVSASAGGAQVHCTFQAWVSGKPY
jgi:hypothetical protein